MTSHFKNGMTTDFETALKQLTDEIALLNKEYAEINNQIKAFEGSLINSPFREVVILPLTDYKNKSWFLSWCPRDKTKDPQWRICLYGEITDPGINDETVDSFSEGYKPFIEYKKELRLKFYKHLPELMQLITGKIVELNTKQS